MRHQMIAELSEIQLETVSGGHNCHGYANHCGGNESGGRGVSGKSGSVGGRSGTTEIVIIELSNFTVSKGGEIEIVINL